MNRRFKAQKSPELTDFPPKLRGLALEICDSERKITLKEACKRQNVNYKSARTMIWRSKKKGKDFYELVNEIYFNHLKEHVYRVDMMVFQKALEGSHKHAELFFKRIGLLKPSPRQERKPVVLGHNLPVMPGTSQSNGSDGTE